MSETNTSNGQTAYEAYREYSDGKSMVSGAPLPTWAGQDERICDAWEAAAEAVLAAQPKATTKCGWCTENATRRIRFTSNAGVVADAHCCRAHVADGAEWAEAATA